MSNATYNGLWAEGMAELTEQVHLENPLLGLPEGAEPPPPPPQANIIQAFQHFACLYIKYMQIFKRLEECYDCMVHPQKREDVLVMLELVIRRVIELKHALVKWNPPNPDVRRPQGGIEENFPWEYVNLDDILVDLKLPPETLEVPVPRYFREDSIVTVRLRDKVIQGYMKLKHNVDKTMAEEEEELEPAPDMSIEQAIDIIQRNERGRQGKQRAMLVKELREEEKRRRMYDATSQMEMDPEIAACNIQRLFRGFFSRSTAAAARDEELVFIGMKPPKHRGDDLENELNMAYKKRKQEQTDNKESYKVALEDLKDVVREEEGPNMRDALREERTLWVTDRIAESKDIPEDLDEFYKEKYPEMKAEEKPEDEDGGKDKKGKGAKEDKKDKKDKGKGKGKGKKDKTPAEDVEPERPPMLQGQSDLTDTMADAIQKYAEDWELRDETDNFAQKHDVELAKRAIRKSVEDEIRNQVDEMLRMNLKKIKMQLTKTAPGKKGKDKGGKGKGKKGGKGKKDKKGGKKGKALPGEKINELKNMEIDQMLSILVECKIINNYRDRHIDQLVGDFNYLGTVHQHMDRKDQGEWIPPDPSMAQLRASITEYCILPNGSLNIKAKLPDECTVKSLMLYGPAGSGKTMMAEAVANELGALFMNISPGRLKGDTFKQHFGNKNGTTKLVHMLYCVARDAKNAPVVIYMDQCDQFFMGGGKKNKNADKDGPGRFKKDLLVYKNQAFQKEDRVIIVGCSSTPEKGDVRDMKNFFDKFLYMPYPDYPSRLMLWRKFIKDQLALAETGARREIPEDFDLSTLAHISEGFSAGAICKTVKKTLTKRRVERLEKRPHNESEFLNCLALEASKNQLTYKNDNESFREFTGKVTGLIDKRNKIRDEKNGDAGGGDKDKKGKKGKGKKGK